MCGNSTYDVIRTAGDRDGGIHDLDGGPFGHDGFFHGERRDRQAIGEQCVVETELLLKLFCRDLPSANDCPVAEETGFR